jgi:hypothetical protein
MKFTSSGSKVWGTYFGGSNEDKALSLAIDKSNNIYITGVTKSTSGIASTGAHQTVYGGGVWDVLLAKFDNNGNRLWSTYYGGSDQESGADIALDKDDNVYLTGAGLSNNAMTTTGAYQTANMGNSDLYIAKFSSQGSLLWGTYYGSTGTDLGESLYIDQSGYIYVAGVSNSTSGLTLKDPIQATNDGSGNALIAKFNQTGDLVWSTFYGGSGEDHATRIIKGPSTDLYILGYTSSNGGVSTNGAYQTNYGGGLHDAFLLKLSDCSISTALSGTASACSNSAMTYKTTPVAGATFDWTVIGGTLASGQGTDSVVVTWGPAGAGFIKVVASTTGGCKDSSSRIISIQPTPNAHWHVTQDHNIFNFKAIDTTLASYSWLFNDGNTASAFKAQHVYPSDGSYKVTLTVTSSNGCTAVFDSTITVVINSVNEQAMPLTDMRFYPNPFSNEFNFEFELGASSHVRAEVLNMTGQVVNVIEDKQESAGHHSYTCNTPLSQGVYLLRFNIDGVIYNSRIVKIQD